VFFLESAMGVKLYSLGNDGEIYCKNLYQIGKILFSRMLKPWLIPEFMFSLFGYQKELDKNLKPVHDFTKSIIKERKANFAIGLKSENLKTDSENVSFYSKKRRYAMMDTLLQAQTQGLIDDRGIIEETDTFTFEGHDTTSAAMTFTLLLLAHNPKAQEKVFNEIHDFLGTKNEWTVSSFNKMEYLDCVIKESLRIYPPIPFISRQFSEDLIIDGVVHPKGGICNVHIFDVHRDPKIFPDPERFDPDRFLPENSANRSNFAFIAFSAGMRNCIGQKFATLELKVMLAKVIRNFKVFPVTTREEIVFIADMVLRSKFPINLKFNPR
jgi:cytochrome P450 family 4